MVLFLGKRSTALGLPAACLGSLQALSCQEPVEETGLGYCHSLLCKAHQPSWSLQVFRALSWVRTCCRSLLPSHCLSPAGLSP